MDTDKTHKVKSRQEAKALIDKCRKFLSEKFGVRQVIPFGSVTREGSWHPGSDLDLAVEGLSEERFFEALAAVNDLVPSQIRVDLVPLEDVKPELRHRILGEVEMPEDTILALKELVKDEVKTLEHLVKEMEELLEVSSDPPTYTELRAIANILHDFYTGIESIFERIVVELNEGSPRGEYCHAELLEQIAAKRENIRLG